MLIIHIFIHANTHTHTHSYILVLIQILINPHTHTAVYNLYGIHAITNIHGYIFMKRNSFTKFVKISCCENNAYAVCILIYTQTNYTSLLWTLAYT